MMGSMKFSIVYIQVKSTNLNFPGIDAQTDWFNPVWEFLESPPTRSAKVDQVIDVDYPL